MSETPELIPPEDLAWLRADANLPHLPTQQTYIARMAISGEGPKAYEWGDKPHRLVYDLCRTIEASAGRPAMPEGMREAVARIIDPEAFDEITADDNEDGAAIFAEAWEEAVAKASAILRLIGVGA